MIDRYIYEEINRLWTDEYRFNLWLDIEKKYLYILSEDKKAPKFDLSNLKINVARIKEIEQTTKHETVAFINSILEQEPKLEPYLHRGLTSSDIIDTAFSIQLQKSGELILKLLKSLLDTVKQKALEHKYTVMLGRTHGMAAEPITLGLKFLLFYQQLLESYREFNRQVESVGICMLSGAVGTYSLIKPSYEKSLAELLGLRTLGITSQIIPRDIYARYFNELAVLMSVMEKIAVDMRLLQQTGIEELSEGFFVGQSGSSVMPHKKNPISFENITGISRLVRSYINAILENIVLWNERDISHSSVERVLAPDITNLVGYALNRLNTVFAGMLANKDRMKENLNTAGNKILSSLVLNYFVSKGFPRRTVYSVVQKYSQKANTNFIDSVAKELGESVDKQEFNIQSFLKHVDYIFSSVLS